MEGLLLEHVGGLYRMKLPVDRLIKMHLGISCRGLTVATVKPLRENPFRYAIPMIDLNDLRPSTPLRTR